MNKLKRYSDHLFSYGATLFLGLVCLVSCTFDYFEDETNYVVYAPKANAELMTQEYSIEDIHIYIYNDETLQNQRTAAFPFQDNARMKLGNFNFRLFPGSYSTYCFANTGEIDFLDMASTQDAAFGLAETDTGEYHSPASMSKMSFEILHPTIMFPGPAVTDTACFDKRYSGRICVAFKGLANINPLLTYNNISNVIIEATGAGIFQRMSMLTDSVHTRSDCYTLSDKIITDCIPYENPLDGYAFGVDGYFFPSLSDGRPIVLTMNFLDQNGASIHAFPIVVPETLHTNQTIYLETDGLSVFTIDISGLEPWDPGIVTEDDGMGI